ncbi:hypothetical protein F4604DRAFT_1684465 [Suillus subluteus]|nr:hypothetical protein F4604DRAFT_1684465 [Suillus subluteus]
MSSIVPAITPQPTFYGDYEKGEEPTNWIKNYLLSFPPSYTEAERISRFELQCAAASPIKAWFTMLTTTETALWATFAAAFKKCWPPPIQTTLTVAQKKDQIQSVVLTEEEIRVMVEEDRGREWGHIKWAMKIAHTALGFNDMQCHLLDVVLENMPEVLRDFLADNYSTWSDFETNVGKISGSKLLKAKQQLTTKKKLRDSGCSKTATPTPSQQTPQSTLAPPPYCYGYRYAPSNAVQPQQISQIPPNQPIQPTQPAPQPFTMMQTPQILQTPQAAALFNAPAPIN